MDHVLWFGDEVSPMHDDGWKAWSPFPECSEVGFGKVMVL